MMIQDKNDPAGSDKLEAALRKVFEAYDLSESGHISARDFLKLEIRHGFELGDLSRIWDAAPRLTRAAQAGSEQLNFDEFCQCKLRAYQSGTRLAWVPTQQGLTKCALQEAERTMTERERMGPRYHPGIRRALKALFHLINMSDHTDVVKIELVSAISPSDWILTRAFLAKAGDPSSKIIGAWLSEDSFKKADINKDGFLQREEFLNLSFEVLETSFQYDVKTALSITENVVQRLDARDTRSTKQKLSRCRVKVFIQSDNPEFQPPTHSRRIDSIGAFVQMGDLQIPYNIMAVEELLALLRLHLNQPRTTWFSVFHRSADTSSGFVHITDVGDLKTMMSSLTEISGEHKLFVKNIRPAPKDLELQLPQVCEDRSFEERLERNFLSGRRWALDWETQLVGRGNNSPICSAFAVGDVLVVRVPESPNNRFAMTFSVYMDNTVAFSAPFLETAAKMAENEKSKKGRKALEPKAPQDLPPSSRGRARGNLNDKNASHLFFVAQREGTCRIFIEISWDHAEEEISKQPACVSQSQFPAPEASIARIGPLALEVRPGVLPPEYMRGTAAPPMLWWNGVKWHPNRPKVLGGKKALFSANPSTLASPVPSPRGSFNDSQDENLKQGALPTPKSLQPLSGTVPTPLLQPMGPGGGGGATFTKRATQDDIVTFPNFNPQATLEVPELFAEPPKKPPTRPGDAPGDATPPSRPTSARSYVSNSSERPSLPKESRSLSARKPAPRPKSVGATKAPRRPASQSQRTGKSIVAGA